MEPVGLSMESPQPQGRTMDLSTHWKFALVGAAAVATAAIAFEIGKGIVTAIVAKKKAIDEAEAQAKHLVKPLEEAARTAAREVVAEVTKAMGENLVKTMIEALRIEAERKELGISPLTPKALAQAAANGGVIEIGANAE